MYVGIASPQRKIVKKKSTIRSSRERVKYTFRMKTRQTKVSRRSFNGTQIPMCNSHFLESEYSALASNSKFPSLTDWMIGLKICCKEKAASRAWDGKIPRGNEAATR